MGDRNFKFLGFSPKNFGLYNRARGPDIFCVVSKFFFGGKHAKKTAGECNYTVDPPVKPSMNIYVILSKNNFALVQLLNASI